MALGRGLSSLIQPKQPATGAAGEKTISAEVSEHRDTVFYLPVNQIQPNPLQPRKSFDDEALQGLATSIKESGVLQPIIVSRTKTGTSGAGFQIITGERRWRASKIAGVKEIPALIRDMPTDQDNLRLAVLENIQREDLNPIELAQAYRRLVDEYGMEQENIGKKIGKSRQSVGNTMRLLTLPQPIQEDIKNETISENHARAILALPTDELRLKLWREIKELKLSARHAEVAARKYKNVPSKSALTLDALTKDMVVKLEARLGTKVTIEPGKHVSDGGKIIIKYFSNEDLRTIVRIITE